MLGMHCGKNHTSESISGLSINPEDSCIQIAARYYPKRFNHALGLKNHHFLVWEKGSAARKALFTTPVPDSAVNDALVSIGAIPGNNLTRRTWEKRNDATARDPDMLVEGSQLDISMIINGSQYHAGDFLADANGASFDFRFGGNRALIPAWKSGCIACLQSCPGGKIGNHSYSIRDLVNKESLFSLKWIEGIKNGDTLTIRISKRTGQP